jgi:hypothetical protein
MASTLARIAFFKNRRDQVPNQELARELADREDRRGIGEIAEGLSHPNPRVRADCLKVLYEIGYLKPRLIEEHVEAFLGLLQERSNRLVWGAMIALSTIAGLQGARIGRHAAQIMQIMEKGSVITVDNGVKTLAVVAASEASLRKKLSGFLFAHLADCRPKDVPQHAEKTLVAIDRHLASRFLAVLDRRLPELSPSQARRVRTVMSAAEMKGKRP